MLNLDYILDKKKTNITLSLRWLIFFIMIIHAFSGYDFTFWFFLGYITSMYLIKYVVKFYVWARSFDPLYIQYLVYSEKIDDEYRKEKPRSFYQYKPPVKVQLVELTGNKHLVDVVDENGRPIDKIKEDTNCIRVVRIDHKRNGEIKHSYNYHYSNGCVVYGDIEGEEICVL